MVTFGFDGVEAGEDRGSTSRRSAGPGTPLGRRTSSGSDGASSLQSMPPEQERVGEVVVSIGGGETESIGGAVDSDPDMAFHARSSNKKEGGRARRPHKAKKTPVMQKTWLKIDANGITTTVQGDPYKHTHKLGVQTRDLRLLDPNLSGTYPSCILDREKAIVVNLEFIKAIISVDAVLIVNPDDDNVSGFVNDLKAKLSSTMTSAMGPKNVSYTGLSDVAPKLPVSRTTGIELPFELKVLEICLDTVSSHLDQLTSDLEAAAYPPLDALTRQVNEGDLERIRRIKSRLVRLTTRVETIREVLEKFLKDDQDMHNLNLTAQQVQDLARLSRASRQYSMTSQEEAEDDDSHSSDSSEDEAEVAEVEMLLEAYFMLLHNTHNRLQTLHEYITDTEDLVNIKLDSHRNQLITVSVVLTALTASLGVVSAAGGIFGMNLDQTMWLQPQPGLFNVVTLTSSITAIVSFAAFMWWCWREDLLL